MMCGLSRSVACGILPNQGSGDTMHVSPALAGRFFNAEPPGKLRDNLIIRKINKYVGKFYPDDVV